jgi:hypothetical protein
MKEHLIFEIASTYLNFLFAGFALYVYLIEHPSKRVLPTREALIEWRKSFKPTAILQSIFTVLSVIFSYFGYYYGGRVEYLYVALYNFINLPYTLIFLMPTNKQLLAIDLGKVDEYESKILNLFETWGHLHAPRVIIGITAALFNLILMNKLY